MFGEQVSVSFHLAELFIVIPLGALFLHVTLKQTPPALRCYRNHILHISFWCLMEILTAGVLGQFQIFFNDDKSKICLMLAGPVCGLHIVVGYVLAVIFSVSFVAMVFAVPFAAFNRYITLAHPLLHERLRSRKGILWCVAALFLVCLVALIGGYLVLTRCDKSYVDNKLIFCLELHSSHEHTNPVVLVCGAFMVLAVSGQSVLMCFFLFLSVRYLRDQRSVMSTRTYRQHMVLTVNVIIITLVSVVFGVIPVILISFGVYFKAQWAVLLFTVTSHLPCLDLLIGWCVMLVFVTPYRQYLIGKLYKLKSWPQILGNRSHKVVHVKFISHQS